MKTLNEIAVEDIQREEDKRTSKEIDKLLKSCQHNWVLDGHNAGETICSKCLARE